MRNLVLMLLLVSNLALAATNRDTAPDYVSFIGTGGLSCGQFVEAKDANHKEQLDLYVQWVWGFLSAYQTHGSFDTVWRRVEHIKSLPDSPTVILFLDTYCHKYPTDDVKDATFGLLKELGVPLTGIKR